jgi:hypothetical protein
MVFAFDIAKGRNNLCCLRYKSAILAHLALVKIAKVKVFVSVGHESGVFKIYIEHPVSSTLQKDLKVFY